VLGTTLLIAVVYILINLVVDVLYGVIDPRIREE
jgi:peptide/nickel transport system permease protein